MSEETKTYIFLPLRVQPLNSLYRYGRGHCYLSKKAKEFKKKMESYLKDIKKLEGEVSLTIIYRLKKKTKSPDLDGLAKLLIDTLKNRAFGDDNLVMSLFLEKINDCEKDEIQILIKKY